MTQERARLVDVEKLTPEEADRLSAQISEKVKEINDKAVESVNRLLNIYGMEAKMQIVIGKINKTKELAKSSAKTKKTSKKKDANL